MNLKEIIPLLAAIVGLTPVFLKWFSDRSIDAAKRRSVEQSKEQVEFWQVWLKAQREVSNDERFEQLKQEVSHRLDILLQKNIEIENKESEKEQGIDKHSFLQKLFLLYIPSSATGWIFHTFFYVTVSFTLMMLLGASVPPEDTNISGWEQLKDELSTDGYIFVFLIAFAFIFQRLARRTEIRYAKKKELKENN